MTFVRASGPGGQNVNKFPLPSNCASMTRSGIGLICEDAEDGGVGADGERKP